MAILTTTQRERARKLRQQETGCEQRLWSRLRARRLAGLKFVRQLPVGPYVADFACREKMIVIEVDGATHGTDEEVAHDLARTRFLEQHGWRVMRVWNEDVVTGIDGVLESILRWCDSL